MSGAWRPEAERVIRGALEEARSWGMSEKATLKLVDSRYPFGERDHWPYKVWLNVRQELVFGRTKPTEWRQPKAEQEEELPLKFGVRVL